MATCIDGKGLLIGGNLPGMLLWASGIVFGLVLLAVTRNLGGEGVYEDNFPRSFFSGVLMIAAAAALAMALPQMQLHEAPQSAAPLLPDRLVQLGGVLKKGLPWAAVVCMALTGLARMAGRRPWWGCSGILCLFFITGLIAQYQRTSADPNLHEYAHQTLALVFLMLAAFHRACCDAGLLCRRKLVRACFGAAFFCLASLGDAVMPRFYLAGALWALGSVCRLAVFPPDPEEEPEADGDEPEGAEAPAEEE